MCLKLPVYLMGSLRILSCKRLFINCTCIMRAHRCSENVVSDLRFQEIYSAALYVVSTSIGAAVQIQRGPASTQSQLRDCSSTSLLQSCSCIEYVLKSE